MDTGEKLFGGIVKRPATGGHTPDDISLRKPLEDPEAVVRSFCTGCGSYLELSQNGVEILERKFSIQHPENLKGHYVLADRCISCADNFENVVLKPIE